MKDETILSLYLQQEEKTSHNAILTLTAVHKHAIFFCGFPYLLVHMDGL